MFKTKQNKKNLFLFWETAKWEMDLKTERFPRKKPQTKLTANVLKQERNTHKVKKKADFEGTTQNKYANLMGQHKG